MGGFFSVPLSGDQVLKDVSYLSCFKSSYIKILEENLVAMERDMEELKARQTDVLRRVEREEDTRSMQRLEEVKRVMFKEHKIKLRLWVSLVLRKVNDLKLKRIFEVVAEPATTNEKRLSRSRPAIVGRETILKRALSLLMRGETRSIGLYGVGGVGKSTILREISNKITTGFDYVIWVAVSQDLPAVKKIQEEIGKKLGFHGEEWNQKEEIHKANDIHNFMKDKRFALLLDDVRTKVDLTKIGVPLPTKENKCGIAFTTRSREVCVQMGVADPIEVQHLSEDDAWDLFQMKLGEHATSCSKIQETARKVAERCRGLPLALNVLGETMSHKKKVRGWNDALRVLTSSPPTATEDEILRILKYSYDSLKLWKLKSCFQYCALFPAGYMFSKDSLVKYWEVEGCVGGYGSSYIAKSKGYENIDTLVRAGLLMESEDNNTKFVRMHDVVREMALWVASDLGKNRERWVVQAGVGLREMVHVKDWTGVRKMSLMNNEMVEIISGSHDCQQLTTLFLQGNINLVRISGEFFQCMPRLAVLDMSSTALEELPEQISRLFSLQYLNLSRTKIERLPDGLGRLRRLHHLNLEMTKRLKSVGGLSDVSSLGVLRLRDSNVSVDASIIEELQHLERLESLSIDVSSSSALKQLSSAHGLAYRIEELCIRDIEEEASLVLPTTMMQLRKLIVKSCGVSEIEIGRAPNDTFLIHPKLGSLSSVTITSCNGLKDLTWLFFVPSLTHLRLQCLDNVVEIISEKKTVGEENAAGGRKTPFDKLKRLELSNLPMLKSVYKSPLLLPCLKKIDVEKCPRLRKLPLSSGSCVGGDGDELVISYSDDEWIERFQWVDKATEERFLLCCEKVIMPSYPRDL